MEDSRADFVKSMPLLMKRGQVLTVLRAYGLGRSVLQRWLENGDLRAVELPHKWAHFRKADVLKLCGPA